MVQTRTPVQKGWVYYAPPTISRFMSSNSFGRLLCGPVGSGKTTSCLVETARRMGQQQPGWDGRRYTRFAIIRQTLKDAKATVLKDARGWFGALADWKVSESTLYIDYADIFSEWMFIPLDEPDDVKRLLSTQLTGAYVNEASEIDIALLSDISGRCGRFPNNEFGAPSWRGLFADTNMPIVNTPWADFIIDPPAEWEVFRQPSGLSNEAENLAHLDQTADTLLLDEHDPIRIEQGRNYYRRLAAVGTVDYVRRYVLADFGRDPTGTAVFAESFKYDFHTDDNLEPIYSRLLIVGQDFGRNPWSLICQLNMQGQLMVLEEVPAVDIGLEQHVKQNLYPVLLNERYLGRPIVVVGDPSGVARDSIFEINCFDLLKSMGLPAERAPTNDIEPRLRAVEHFLVRQIAGRGAIIIDRHRCPMLVQGMNGGYRYSKTKDDVARSLPDKNKWSHVNDCLQYVALIAGSMGAYQWLLGRVISTRTKRPKRPRVSSLGWT
jgi:hypothetical protein